MSNWLVGILSYISNAVGIAISFILPNAYNQIPTVDTSESATVTAGGTSKTYARVYDDTDGLKIAEIPAGVAASEGMRLSGDAADVIDIGSNLNPNLPPEWFYQNGCSLSSIGGGVYQVNNCVGAGFYNFIVGSLTTGAYYHKGIWMRTLSGSATGLLRSAFGDGLTTTFTITEEWSLVEVAGPLQNVDGTDGFYILNLTTETIQIKDNMFIYACKPVFFNDDGNGNKLTPTIDVPYNDKGDTFEVMQFVDARENGEAVVSDVFKATPISKPHSYYYQNQEGFDISGSLYFVAEGGHTLVIEGNETKITYAGSGSIGMSALFRTSYGLLQSPVIGQEYTVKFKARVSNGASVNIGDAQTPKYIYNITNTEIEEFSYTFICNSTNLHRLAVYELSVGESCWVSDVKILKISKPTSFIEPKRDALGRYYEELYPDPNWTNTLGYLTILPETTLASGVLTVNTSASYPYVLQGNAALQFESSKRYRVSFDQTTTAGSLRFYLDGNAVNSYVASNGRLTFYITGAQRTPTSNNMYQWRAGSTGFQGTISNFSVCEVDANDNPINILDGGRRVAATNYFKYSEDFRDTAQAGESRATIIGGGGTVELNSAIAPDGTMTANKFTEGTGNADFHRFYQSNTIPAGIRTLSLFVKYIDRQWIALKSSAPASPVCCWWFDVKNMVLGSDWEDGCIDAKIEEVGNGWCRLSLTMDATANGNAYLFHDDGDRTGTSPHFTGEGKSNYYWGFQVELGLEATEYIPTTDSTVTEAENVDESVVWEYKGKYNNLGGGHLTHILNEPAATNLIINSGDMGAALIENEASYTPNTTVAPDGTLTADTMAATATSSHHSGYFAKTTGNTVGLEIVLSVFAKAGTLPYTFLAIYDSNAYHTVVFNVETGEVTSTNGTPTNYGIEKVGNGFYRIWMTKIATETQIKYCRVGLSNSAVPTFSNGLVIYEDDGNGTGIHWGLQLEAGAVPTSYIPTGSGTVTRAATKFSTPKDIFPTGVFQARLRWVLGGSGNEALLMVDDSGNLNKIQVLWFTNGNLLFYMWVHNARKDVFLNANAYLSSTEPNFIGIKADGVQMSISINGVDRATKTINAERTVPADGKTYIGCDENVGYESKSVTDIQINADVETDPDWYKDTTWSEV